MIVTYAGRTHPIAEGATVLDALLAGGESIPHACRAGVCGACILRVTTGPIPPESQVGMRDTWKAQGYVHACRCRPRGPLALEPLGEGMLVGATVVERRALSPTVSRVQIALATSLDALAGQYVTLHRASTARSFSIAMRRGTLLDLHVRRVPGGAMSPYLCDEAQPGDALSVQGPYGHCVYLPGRPEQSLLLAGTGTGLAPLWGVLHDALASGHTGPIHVFHGAVDPDGLYLVDELRAIAAAQPQVRYVPSVLRRALPGMDEGPLDAVVARHVPRTVGMRVYVCGAPDVVPVLKKKLFLAGAVLQDIASDAFLPTAR
jgi:NAD(P)H-flavin reductase/ferredoxin